MKTSVPLQTRMGNLWGGRGGGGVLCMCIDYSHFYKNAGIWGHLAFAQLPMLIKTGATRLRVKADGRDYGATPTQCDGDTDAQLVKQ